MDIDRWISPSGGELAYQAGISAQSASAHLTKLVDGGLLAAEAQGRHRYFRIANAEVACMIESMAALSPGIELALPKCLPSTRLTVLDPQRPFAWFAPVTLLRHEPPPDVESQAPLGLG